MLITSPVSEHLQIKYLHFRIWSWFRSAFTLYFCILSFYLSLGHSSPLSWRFYILRINNLFNCININLLINMWNCFCLLSRNLWGIHSIWNINTSPDDIIDKIQYSYCWRPHNLFHGSLLGRNDARICKSAGRTGFP